MTVNEVHILLAEDDRDDRLFFKNAFKDLKINHRLSICENGTDLMDYIEGAETIPDILFLDLNMPGKNGFVCLKEIRSKSRYIDMSVAIYTSLSLPAIQNEVLSAGANVFIKKPNDPALLKKILLEVLYINWQYMTDGLSKENFMLSYQ
ncbi:response regulator [Flavobacterium zepuense]|uniref:Response regulator n=1 Tax=Flavobacterium zepuense TaxID=2593302 RepID=A0A552V9N9_9FLAO|nr:response regulator [Flavobacterium zepuense]TRW27187.1 response regulator [Flavobacterium zepuense]